MDSDEFKTKRKYKRGEVAKLLNVPDSWLKDWVTQRAIPLQMSGLTRGVWFTFENVHQIGSMLPDLMTERQANARARTDRVPSPVARDSEPSAVEITTSEGAASETAPPVVEVPVVTGGPPDTAALERFRHLRAIR